MVKLNLKMGLFYRLELGELLRMLFLGQTGQLRFQLQTLLKPKLRTQC
jgi:hypothetical protein